MSKGGASWWARWWPTSRRRRWLLAALAALILVRVNLPWIVRWVIVSQASKTLQADVTLADVDLAFYRGGVALEDFAIRLRGASPPTGSGAGASAATAAGPAAGPPETSSPPLAGAAGSSPPGRGPAASSPASPDATIPPGASPPILEWKNLVVSLRWLPLLRKTIELREIVLDSPQVRLDRLASGEFNYEALLRAALAPAEPDAAPAAPTTDSGAPAGGSESAPADGGSAAAAGASGWWLGIDRLALLGGHVRFHDHTRKGSEPIDVAIPTIEVRDISMSPDLYGKPSESHLNVALDEGSLEVGARTAMSGNDIDLECDLRAQALPLRHARLYVPRVGWSELTGALDADLGYRLKTAPASKMNEVRGTVALRDLAVRVPDLSDAALSWTRLAVRVDPIDLVAQRAAIAEVDLSGARIAVRAKSMAQLPLFAAPESDGDAPAAAEGAPRTDEGGGQPRAASQPAEATSNPPPEGGTPWTWSVQAIRLTDSGVRLLADDATLDVRMEAQVTDVAPTPDTLTHVNVSIGIRDGSIRVEGRARLEPPGFAGDVDVTALSLAEPLAISGAVPQNMIESATLDTHLSIEAGLAKTEGAVLDPGDVRTSGTVSLADAIVNQGDTRVGVARVDVEIGELALAGAMPAPASSAGGVGARGALRLRGGLSVRDASVGLVPLPGGAADLPAETGAGTPGTGSAGAGVPRPSPAMPAATAKAGPDFSIGLSALDLALSDLTLPGLLGGAPAAPEPMRVAIAELKIDKPVARLTRTAAGIVLPGMSAAPVITAAPPPAETTAAPAAAGAAPAPPPEAAAAPAPGAAPPPAATAAPEITLGSLRVTKGRFAFADRALTPPFTANLDDITVSGRDLRLPELTAKDLRISLSTPAEGEIEMSGTMAAHSGKLKLDVRDVALMPYNPYAMAFSPYRVSSGALSLSTGVKRADATYTVANEITLQDFDVEGAGGEGIFERQFGIPLATALALLRDPAGKIALKVPVEIGERGTSVDVMAVVGRALRAALLGALTSPLKLVGSLTGGGDKIGSFAPAPIVFHTGRADVTSDGAAIVERLGTLLESRPAMGVELGAAMTTADARWLREQALLARWDEEGFVGGLMALTDRGARTRVREALEARAKDEGGELSPEDARALEEWLREVPETTPEQLRVLAAQRLAAVTGGLRAGRNIEESHILALEPTGGVGDAAPAVEVRLRPASRLGVAAEPIVPEEGDPGAPSGVTP